MAKEGYVEISEDKLYKVSKDKSLCVYCGNVATHYRRYHDHWDEEEWHECNCETAKLITSKREEVWVLERQLATISDELKKLSSKESVTVKNLRIQKEIQAVLNKHQVGIGRVVEIFKEENK